MIGVGLHIGDGRGGQGYSAEYQAVLDRATALGYTHPSSAQKTKQNTLIQSLKDAGIWDLLDVFYVFATDGSSDFATLNWKSPSSNQCSKVNSPTFTSNLGFSGNGTSSYLNTNWIPSTNGVKYQLNNSSYFTSVGVNIQSNSATIGTLTDGASRYILLNSRSTTNDYDVALNSTAIARILTGSSLDGSGFSLVNRISSTHVNAYRNGSKLSADVASSSVGIPTRAVYLLARNNAGVADAFAPRRLSCAGFGSNLESKQSDLYTAWNTYLTSL